MLPVFYISSAVAVISTILMITRLRAIHSLLYLVVSLLAIAVVFYTLGAPFPAVLEIIIYAGAIMVLFVFMIMTLNIGDRAIETERLWLEPKAWIGPAILAAILTVEFIDSSAMVQHQLGPVAVIEPKQVGIALFGPYVLSVELASILLLAGIIGAFRLGWIPLDALPEHQNKPVERAKPAEKEKPEKETKDELESARQRVVAGGNPVHARVSRAGDAP